MSPPSGRAVIRGLLRPLLPVLLGAATLELLISRVLSRGGVFRAPRLDPRTGFLLDQIGYLAFTFSIVMALGLMVLLGFLSLRLRFWPASLPSWIGPGLILFAAWTLARALFPGLAPAFLYHSLSLVLALAMLSAFFSASERSAPRTFAVLLSASLICGAYVVIADSLHGPAELPWRYAVARAGELIALAGGAVVLAVLPRESQDEPRAFSHATLAGVCAALYLVLDLRGGDGNGGTGIPRWSLGWMRDLPFPDPFTSLLYAGVLFLFAFALFHALADPRWRLRGYGLALLFLAGVQYRIAYQHLLGLIGLVLLTGGAPPDATAEPTPSPAEV